MSRTIRRKNYVPVYYLWDYERDTETGAWYARWIEGDELKQILRKYHSCKHGRWKDPSKATRQHFENNHRMNNKIELHKFNRNPEYEVQTYRKRLLPWN